MQKCIKSSKKINMNLACNCRQLPRDEKEYATDYHNYTIDRLIGLAVSFVIVTAKHQQIFYTKTWNNEQLFLCMLSSKQVNHAKGYRMAKRSAYGAHIVPLCNHGGGGSSSSDGGCWVCVCNSYIFCYVLFCSCFLT